MAYEDDKGYLRDSDKKLVHRKIAYEHIYNKDIYPLPFSEYAVHHINGNKQDNRVSNLQLLTWRAHNALHNDTRYGTLYNMEFNKRGVWDRIRNTLLFAFCMIIPAAFWVAMYYATGGDIIGEFETKFSAIWMSVWILIGLFITWVGYKVWDGWRY